jgi:hypothetical protein
MHSKYEVTTAEAANQKEISPRSSKTTRLELPTYGKPSKILHRTLLSYLSSANLNAWLIQKLSV